MFHNVGVQMCIYFNGFKTDSLKAFQVTYGVLPLKNGVITHPR